MYTAPIIVSAGYTKSSFKLETYSELTMKKIFLVDWVVYKACMQCSLRSSSLATVPYSMKNLIACFHFSSDVQHPITAVLHPQNGNFARLLCYSTVQENVNFNFIVLSFMCHALISAFNLPGTNFSIKQSRGENCEPYRTGPDQLHPRAFALRPNRALLVLAIFKRVIDEKMFALRLRTSAT